jgi:aspartyl-tRNA(Asn)/glutamyl-tRNA(Gln) amidotransferase subunit C
MRIARLARLELSDEEIERYREELGQILELVGELDQLDTEGVEPTSHVLDLINVLRQDQPRPPLSREAALENAPEVKEGKFRVPPILKKGPS